MPRWCATTKAKQPIEPSLVNQTTSKADYTTETQQRACGVVGSVPLAWERS